MSKNKKRGIILVIVILIIIILAGWYFLVINKQSNSIVHKPEIKIGFIGAMTGPLAKYGAYEATQLAIDNINAAGGINGMPVKLIAEDGKGDSATAVTAMNKLINVDGVKVILGGHNSPESNTIAPIADENKVIMLASISSGPGLKPIGNYVFRTTPISTVQSDIVSEFAINKLNLKKMAIIYEQTDYARPIAEKMKEGFSSLGGNVVLYDGYNPGTIDFKTILLKIKNNGADSIFISVQNPDASFNFQKQLKELNINNIKIFGNDVAIVPANVSRAPDLYEGIMGALVDFDINNPKTKAFIDKYNAKYNTQRLPYDVWTAESYDATMILADAISKNGLDVEKLKTYFQNGINNYDGVSGTFGIDKKGNGIRGYSLKIVKDGKILNYNN
ncbi:MAG: ABC transporter substrate-binding protein [Candidatus Buchananbacteria bacterium]